MTLSELKEIIKSKYLHHGDYTLSSGAKSKSYFDLKGLMGNPLDADTLKEEMRDKLNLLRYKDKLNYKSLGGTELGGALIAAMLAAHPFEMYDVCYIRKSQRIHGLKKMLEGCPKSPILLVDDVFSSGDTIRHAINECYKAEYEVCGILCVINRSPIESIMSFGMNPDSGDVSKGEWPIYSLFKESDFD